MRAIFVMIKRKSQLQYAVQDNNCPDAGKTPRQRKKDACGCPFHCQPS
jgi:hypothetical protein